LAAKKTDVHLRLSEDKRNIPIFSQQMLDTTFEDWQQIGARRRPGSRLKLYVNGQDERPLTLTITE
jgi:hypothetical protein